MRVLSIGNSFSQDAHRYLHGIAGADGTELKTVNLYIGGCPLRTHYINSLEDSKAYELEFNGEITGFKVSVKEALISDDWDAVTLQQVSSLSPDYETYRPYLEFMRGYIKKYSPRSAVYMHQTWAYEKGSERLAALGYSDPDDMLSDNKKAYEAAAAAIGADGIIPSGEVFSDMLGHGIERIHRDTFHASLGLGRYALGLTWYACLTGRHVRDNSFTETDEPVTAEEMEKAKTSVERIVFQER